MTGLGSVLKRRALVYAVLPILLLLVVPAASAWAVPVFGTPTPAPGATISAASAAVSVAVSDAAGLSSTPTMTVDGVPAVCRMEYYDTGGTWYDDGCESWYQPAYDYTRGTIRADLTGLANGSRTIAVRAVNRAGVGQVSSWSLNVSSAPLLSAPFPANGGWVADVRPTISAKVAANAPVASVSLTVDGAPTSAWYDATTKKVMGTPLANLADGLSHTAVARATDSFGLTGSITWTFGTATTGPVIGGQLPAADAQLTTGTTRIAFSAADPSSFSAVSLKLDGASVPVTWDYVDMGGSWYDDGCEGWYEPAYDYTRMSAGYSATGLRDGTHTVVAEATGRTGIASTATWTFRVTSRPIIDAASPANGACTANLRPVISARISDNDTITATTMALDGAAVPATYDASAKTIRFTPLTPLADDSTHTVLVTASDAAGNPSSLQWSFRTKSSPPVFSGASPAAGSVTSAYRPAISLSVSDAAGLSSTASLSVDGVKVASSFAYVDAGGTWEDDDFESWYVPAYDYTRGTISYTPAADLTNGPHTVTVEQANSLGVKSTYAWTFTITAPPVLSSPVPANGASVVTLSPTISVAVKANVGIAAATATLDGVPTPALWDAAAKVVRVVPIAPLPDNTGHTVCVTVTDAAGQQGSYLWSFNTDVSGPSIGAVSPSAGATLSANSVRISVVASDPAGMAGMQTMKIDGATVPALWAYVEIGGYWVGTGCSAEYIAEYDQTQGTLAYQATALSDGQHTVSVTLANVSGITATKTWTFTVAVPPQITTPVPSYGAVIATLTPTIGAKVTDNGTVATTRVTLDGVTIASSYDPASKTVTAMAIPALSDDTQHTAVVYATDAVGGASSLSWSFRTHTAVPTLLTAAPATSTAVWDPVVSIDARDAAGLKGTATMRIDGGVVPAAVAFVDLGGSWYDDGCESWYEPAWDYTRGTISYRPAKLVDGLHTASVEIANVAGTTTSQSWTFEVKAPPKLSDARPSAESKLTTQTPEISVGVAENSAVATVAATLDGASVPASYDAATGRVRVLPAGLLSNDVDHEVTVRVTDTAGYAGEIRWKFHIQIFMEMASSMGCGDCHTAVGHTTSNCVPCHGSDCSGSGCHGGGHGILTFQPTECAGCHPGNGIGHGDVTAAHSSSRDMAPCRPCHVLSLTTEHARRKDGAGATMTCASCHESSNTKVTAAVAAGSTDCAACHDMGSPSGAGHLEQHAEVTLAPECLTCHRSNIVTEHLSNTRTQDASLTCDTCHASTDADVTAAIAGGDTECAACHAATHGDLAVVHTPTDVGSVACTGDGCHGDGDALRIHSSRTEGECAVCHANPTRGDLAAGKTSAGCAGCHENHQAAHVADGLPATVRMFTTGHVGRIADVAIDCGLCHEVTDIAKIHGNACATCHPSPRNSFTTWTGGCQQGACHPTYHTSANAGHIRATDDCEVSCHPDSGYSTIVPAKCGYCHKLVDHEAPRTTSDAKSSYIGPATVRLSPSDLPDPGGSGVARTHWRLDGGPPMLGLTAIAPQSAEGSEEHTLEFWSVDVDGNAEATKTVHFVVNPDSEPPVSSSDAKAEYSGGAATIVLTATDNGSSLPATRYILDSAPATTGPVVNVTKIGQHTLRYWAEDAAGNVETAHVVTFTISSTGERLAPVTMSDAVASYSGTATITLTATDEGGSGVVATYWRLDGGAPTVGTSVKVATPGNHRLEFWSVDGEGNEELPHKTANFSVTFPIATGLVRFIWENPPAGAWTTYAVYVYDSSNRLVATATNETGYWDAIVPVSATPYRIQAYWYDPTYDDETPYWSESQALIDAPGKVITWHYR